MNTQEAHNTQNNSDSSASTEPQSIFTELHGKYFGRVKWFKSKLGYGFITVLCDNEEVDIFIHQSNIKTKHSHYRTLKDGEYVSLDLSVADDSKQAVNVTGVGGGPLVCDNKHSVYRLNKNKESHDDEDGEGDDETH